MSNLYYSEEHSHIFLLLRWPDNNLYQSQIQSLNYYHSQMPSHQTPSSNQNSFQTHYFYEKYFSMIIATSNLIYYFPTLTYSFFYYHLCSNLSMHQHTKTFTSFYPIVVFLFHLSLKMDIYSFYVLSFQKNEKNEFRKNY